MLLWWWEFLPRWGWGIGSKVYIWKGYQHTLGVCADLGSGDKGIFDRARAWGTPPPTVVAVLASKSCAKKSWGFYCGGSCVWSGNRILRDVVLRWRLWHQIPTRDVRRYCADNFLRWRLWVLILNWGVGRERTDNVLRWRLWHRISPGDQVPKPSSRNVISTLSPYSSTWDEVPKSPSKKVISTLSLYVSSRDQVRKSSSENDISQDSIPGQTHLPLQ